MSDKPPAVLRGTVTKLFHSSPHFSAGRLRPAGQRSDVSFAGKVYCREGDAVTLRGEWTTHEKYGEQFQVASLVYDAELDADGLAAWLTMHGDAAGIGPVRAQKIAREYGKDFGTILREDPESLAIFAKVPVESIRQLATAWAEREEFNAVACKLAAWELSHHEIELLVEKFGASAVTILEDNPYLLLNEVPGLGFAKIDGMALKLGIPKTHPGRLRAGVIQALRQARDDGSTCQEHNRLIATADELLALDDLHGDQRIVEVLGQLITEAKAVHAITDDQRQFYALTHPLRQETLITRTLTEWNGPNPSFPGEAAERVAAVHCASLHDESQERAVAMALRNRVSVITGAAGSGKTTVVRAIVNAYTATRKTVALCAPTGKAARRLEEVVNYPASTIHRLLDYHPKLGFRSDERNPISADVVVCDELSMVDSELAYHLLRAVSKTTAVVMVGDHHQLPPVGPGALLRDAIRHELCPVAILGKCHRQAGPLKANSTRILEGAVAPTEPKDDATGYSPWIVHDCLTTPEEILSIVARLFSEVIPRYGFRVPWEVQFMSPMHKGPVGTAAINVALQRLHQQSLGNDIGPSSPEKKPALYVGDKVIQTRNNYTLNVMNGHQGEVLSVKPLIVDFDGRAVDVPNDCRGDVELAYCLTPHKMQGSEVPVAVTVCHRSASFMLHRNWLYTAQTRARKCAILIGDDWSVRKAAERVVANQRLTLLGILAKTQTV